jgi:membrane-associated phospholipid phosphatase
VVGAHYLGDALAGALIAVLTTRCVACIVATRGIDLAAARQGLDLPEEALPR